MPTYGFNDVRVGLKILLDGDPYNIVDADFVKPGKGQAFTRLKIKNMLNGRVTERTYKASESIEGADVVETNMTFLYSDGSELHFMDPASYEQHNVPKESIGEMAGFLKEQDTCSVVLWNGRPISVSPPNHVILAVVETDPGLRGDTSSGGTKPATLETGAVVKVPLFIQIGDVIKVDTRTSSYLSRAKE